MEQGNPVRIRSCARSGISLNISAQAIAALYCEKAQKIRHASPVGDESEDLP